MWNFLEDITFSDLSLEAVWELSQTINYLVVFKSNGGSKVSSISVAKNSKVKEPRNPTYEGMKFDGWYTSLSFEMPWNFNTFVVSDAVSTGTTLALYAKWIPGNITTSKLNKYSYTNLPSGELNGVKVSLKEY